MPQRTQAYCCAHHKTIRYQIRRGRRVALSLTNLESTERLRAKLRRRKPGSFRRKRLSLTFCRRELAWSNWRTTFLEHRCLRRFRALGGWQLASALLAVTAQGCQTTVHHFFGFDRDAVISLMSRMLDIMWVGINIPS